MALVTLRVGGRAYDIACRAGEEARFQALGELVDARVADVTRAAGGMTETRQLLFAAMLLADEVQTAQAAAMPSGDALAAATAIERLAERAEAIADRLEQRTATS